METIKKNQSKMKETLTEIKNNLKRINSRVDEAKNQKAFGLYRSKKCPIILAERKKSPKSEDSVRSHRNNCKLINIRNVDCWKDKRESKRLKTCFKK